MPSCPSLRRRLSGRLRKWTEATAGNREVQLRRQQQNDIGRKLFLSLENGKLTDGQSQVKQNDKGAVSFEDGFYEINGVNGLSLPVGHASTVDFSGALFSTFPRPDRIK